MSDERSPIRITRAHYTDLVCAAMNDTTGDTQKILDRMEKNPGFQIDERPVEGVFYVDQSICFMYPHEIKPINFDELRPKGEPLSGGFKAGAAEVYSNLNAAADAVAGKRTLMFDVESHLPDLDLGALQITGRETYRGSAEQLEPFRDPDPVQPEIDATPERPKPSGLLMSLLSRI